MLFTVKDDLRIIKKLKLTPRQLIFLKILMPDPRLPTEGERRREVFARSLEYQELSPLSADELADLISRDMIVDLNKPGAAVYYDSFDINDKFKRHFALKIIGTKAEELVEAYPTKLRLDGSLDSFNARNAGPEEIAEDYLKAIKDDDKVHDRILDSIKWATDNNVLSIGLKKFVTTRHWHYIEELRKRSGSSKDYSDVRIG
jgi:hypothetical protein